MFACSICRREFRTYSGMYSHRHLRHGGQPRIACQVCGRKFMTTNSRNQHHYREHSVQAPLSADSPHVRMMTSVTSATTMHD
jgi:hypothetical protein